MKTTMTIKRITLVTLLSAVLAVPALAQPGPGSGGGSGGGPGAQGAMPCAANATNCGPGMMGGGPGSGRGMGPGGRHGMRFSQKNTAGWSLMTAEERTAHREKMFSVKTYDECKLVQTDHRKQMETRAKEKGVTLPEPRANGCDRMKARGIFK